MNKIFMVMLGGKAPLAKVEVHDIVFTTSDSLENAYEKLRNQWFGLKDKVHIDAYREVNYVDGYKISLEDTQKIDENVKLYFIQMGGYTHNVFGENHNYELIVASSLVDAKAKAKSLFFTEQFQPHVDSCMDVDTIIEINQIEGKNIFLQKYDASVQPDKVTVCYIPIPLLEEQIL